MSANELSSLVSNLGFPIVACGALFWMNIKTSETYAKTIAEMRKTIEDNTRMIKSFIEKMESKWGIGGNEYVH